MTWRNEVMDGLTAAKASADLTRGFIYGDPKDDYYREAVVAARRQNEQDRIIDRDRARSEAGSPAATAMPNGASTNTAIQTTAMPNRSGGVPVMPTQTASAPRNSLLRSFPPDPSALLAGVPRGNEGYRRGGSVRKQAIVPGYARGGPVEPYTDSGSPSFSDEGEESEADLIIKGILARDASDAERRVTDKINRATARPSRTNTDPAYDWEVSSQPLRQQMRDTLPARRSAEQEDMGARGDQLMRLNETKAGVNREQGEMGFNALALQSHNEAASAHERELAQGEEQEDMAARGDQLMRLNEAKMSPSPEYKDKALRDMGWRSQALQDYSELGQTEPGAHKAMATDARYLQGQNERDHQQAQRTRMRPEEQINMGLRARDLQMENEDNTQPPEVPDRVLASSPEQGQMERRLAELKARLQRSYMSEPGGVPPDPDAEKLTPDAPGIAQLKAEIRALEAKLGLEQQITPTSSSRPTIPSWVYSTPALKAKLKGEEPPADAGSPKMEPTGGQAQAGQGGSSPTRVQPEPAGGEPTAPPPSTGTPGRATFPPAFDTGAAPPLGNAPGGYTGPDRDFVGMGSPTGRFLNPNQVPPPNRPETKAQTGGAGTSTPGGAGTPAAPPTGAGGGGGGGGGGTAAPAAPGSLGDQKRIAAFDPRYETGAGAVDASGRDIRGIDTGPPGVGAASQPASGMTGGQADQGMSTNNVGHDVGQLKQVLAGAASIAKPGPNGEPPYVGQKAAGRPVLQQVIQQNNRGGQDTPGNAMLRGMLSMYQNLMRFGRVEEANKMAYGLIQAANLEMAAHGSYAIDQMRRGDAQGAARTIVAGIDFAPDGMDHRLSADGASVETVDPRTGKVSGTTPIDGRWILAAATGMRNGDMMWKALQASAENVHFGTGKTDKQTLMMRHLIDIERLKGLKLRNAKAAGGGGGAAVPNIYDQRMAEIKRRREGGGRGGYENLRQNASPSAEDVEHERFLNSGDSSG